MQTFADRVISFNRQLRFTGDLPNGISILNPFQANEAIVQLSNAFYKKYYDDLNNRYLILGINPGRFGGAITGIPFTDTKRLADGCGIKFTGKETHEPSSVFIYEMIQAYGGANAFYKNFYIHSICPLGFTALNARGNAVNYNYYDSRELTNRMYAFIIENIKKQIELGVETNTCFCFGTGKNEKFLRTVNDKYKFFSKIVALEHPRFIMQYKSKTKQEYIEKYIKAFRSVLEGPGN